MPYLAKDRKQYIDGGGQVVTEGDLTYVLTRACLNACDIGPFLENALNAECGAYLENGRNNYATRCQIMGALECARREFRRRRPDSYLMINAAISEVQRRFYDEIIAPYEDSKIEFNGDVF